MAEDKYINVEIVTPERSVYSGSALAVTLPGSLAPFQVLYNHAPIVSALDEGIIKIKSNNTDILFIVASKGFVEVLNNKVSAMVEKAYLAPDIDEVKERELLQSIKTDMKQALNEDEKNELADRAAFSELKIKAVEKAKSNK